MYSSSDFPSFIFNCDSSTKCRSPPPLYLTGEKEKCKQRTNDNVRSSDESHPPCRNAEPLVMCTYGY